jgi:hypothetical protein
MFALRERAHASAYLTPKHEYIQAEAAYREAADFKVATKCTSIILEEVNMVVFSRALARGQAMNKGRVNKETCAPSNLDPQNHRGISLDKSHR